jgi:ABC-type arginine transport system permease subunit
VKMDAKKLIWASLICALIAAAVSASNAQTIAKVPCLVIRNVYQALARVGPAIVFIFMFYGAGKYVYSSEDPGGRKQGKDIFIHALIAGIILVLVNSVATMLGILGVINDICTPGLW